MNATERLEAEQLHHDAQADARREYFLRHPEELLLAEEQYLNHASWIRPALARLGNVAGKQVLDYGCGHGTAAVLFAKREAIVTGFDLSGAYVHEAKERARANGVRVRFLQAAAEELPFPDETFDAVWGNAILHHLDLDIAGTELARVMKPDAIAVFCEPWGENPLLEWARRRLPYPGKDRSRDERPLRERDLPALARHFNYVTIEPFQLLGMARRVWPGLPFHRTLDRCDAVLLRRWRSLGKLCRYIVLSLREPRRV
jgi:SAM-dependent methyltransferase